MVRIGEVGKEGIGNFVVAAFDGQHPNLVQFISLAGQERDDSKNDFGFRGATCEAG